MIKFQNINLAVLESDIGLIVMTKNYMSVDINEANEIVSNIFNKNEYYLDESLRNGFTDVKKKVVIHPLNVSKVSDSLLEAEIMSVVYDTFVKNTNWINNGNLTENEKILFKNILIERKKG